MHESMSGKTVAELLEFFTARRPGFAEGLAGATEAEVRELQTLVGRPLPDDYVVFLRAAGRNTSNLFKGEGQAHLSPASSIRFPLQYDFTIDAALKHYRWLRGKLKRKPELASQNRFHSSMIRIGTQTHSEDGGSYYLDCRADPPPVVKIDEYNEVTLLAPSFKEFLVKYAFLGKRFEQA